MGPTTKPPKARSKSSPFKGVRRDKSSGRWIAEIRCRKRIGTYLTPEEAHQAYLTATAGHCGGASSSQPPPPEIPQPRQLKLEPSPVSPPMKTPPPKAAAPQVSDPPPQAANPAVSAPPFSIMRYLLSPTLLPLLGYYGMYPIAPPHSCGSGFQHPPLPLPRPSTDAVVPASPPLPSPPPPANNEVRRPYPAEPPGFERWGPRAISKAGPSQRPR